jgi:hypothetical protein
MLGATLMLAKNSKRLQQKHSRCTARKKKPHSLSVSTYLEEHSRYGRGSVPTQQISKLRAMALRYNPPVNGIEVALALKLPV